MSEDPEHATICDRTARCTVNVLWVRIRDAITGTLEGMTLADLVPTTLSLPVQLDGVVARTVIHPEPVVV